MPEKTTKKKPRTKVSKKSQGTGNGAGAVKREVVQSLRDRFPDRIRGYGGRLGGYSLTGPCRIEPE